MNTDSNCYYETIAMAVVFCKNKILATNEIIYGKEVLSLPKGHKEENKSLTETAIRKCFEETNVIITTNDPIKELTPFSYEFLTPSNKFIKKTIVPFLFEINNEATPMPKEDRIISVQWMDKDEFIKNCSHDNVRTVVMSIR